MAYVGQLLLNSTQAIKNEIMNAQNYSAWCRVSRNALTEKLPQPPPMESALPVDFQPADTEEVSEENDQETQEIVEPQDTEGNFAQEAEEEYEVTAPTVFDPSSFNEEYDAKNNESRLLSDLKELTQVLHPKKL